MIPSNNILINILGIQDSGGVTVFEKLLLELKDSKNSFVFICNDNKNVNNLVEKYSAYNNFIFKVIVSKGFIHRLYYENIIFRKIIKDKNISLVYNFSGSTQFFSKVPQLTKVHNLLFYCKKIDKVYFFKKKYIGWLKQIYIKRVVFHIMLRQVSYIEVQSNHVKNYINDFINIANKRFFIKSDIDVKDELFKKTKDYRFSKKLRLLYIVGPHFEYLHKNFEDFVKVIQKLKEENFEFEVIVTLTRDQLYNSYLWDKTLEDKTIFLGYVSTDKLKDQFQDNTILISTSVIETLGLHVIEAIQNGILSIAPNEKYSLNVYGNDILTYDLFDCKSLLKTIKDIILLDNNKVKDIIIKNQEYLIINENKKYQNIKNIFAEILKDKNVQK